MPAATVTFTLTVSVAGESKEFVLSARQVESLVSGADDTPEFADLFSAAAQHSARNVRCAAAGQDQLPTDAALALASDPCADVRERVARNRAFYRIATDAAVLKLITSDPEIADAIAGNVEQFENADADALCEALSKHPDPTVRRTLAWNSGTPVKWLRKLRNDPAPEVAATAAQMMAQRSR